MSLTIHQAGPVSILCIEGKLILGDPATAFREAVEEMLKAGNQRIVLNFSGVPYADSSGVGALAVNFSNVKAAGGSLAVAAVQQAVRDVMELTRLTDLIPFFESEQEAIQSFGLN